MSHTTEDSQKENYKKKLVIIKRIRSLDKDLRGRVKDLPLFKVTFKHLRDLPEERLIEVEAWYEKLITSENFKKLGRIYNENPPEYWKDIPNYFGEHEKMRYRQQVFVSEARNSMPLELKRNA